VGFHEVLVQRRVIQITGGVSANDVYVAGVSCHPNQFDHRRGPVNPVGVPLVLFERAPPAESNRIETSILDATLFSLLQGGTQQTQMDIDESFQHKLLAGSQLVSADPDRFYNDTFSWSVDDVTRNTFGAKPDLELLCTQRSGQLQSKILFIIENFQADVRTHGRDCG
jgi:hypothetical protein